MTLSSHWLAEDENKKEGWEIVQYVARPYLVDTFSLASTQPTVVQENEIASNSNGYDIVGENINSDTATNETSFLTDDSSQQAIRSNCDCVSEERKDVRFNLGDHVYTQSSFLGIPCALLHHGIIIDRNPFANTITLLDFSCLSMQGNAFPYKDSHVSTSINHCNDDCFLAPQTIKELDARLVWKKVRYDASFLKRYAWYRQGTVSIENSDPIDVVLARTEFLRNNRSSLLFAVCTLRMNSEHVAAWCKTGHFSSFHILSNMLDLVVLSTVPAIVVCVATKQVASEGIWGWLGHTTTVPLASGMPWLVTGLVLLPVLTVTKLIFDANGWKQATELWKTAFEDWVQATNRSVANSSRSQKDHPVIFRILLEILEALLLGIPSILLALAMVFTFALTPDEDTNECFQHYVFQEPSHCCFLGHCCS